MYESSIYSKNPLNFANSSELESSDWELQMAKLVGLEEDYPSTNIEELPAVDVEESIPASSSQPQELQTQQSLSSNPFAKLALVSAATLVVVLVAGVFLSQLMNVGNQKRNNNTSLPVQPQPTNQVRPQHLESEVETLKTKLALTEQAEALKTAQKKLRSQVIASQSSLPTRTQPSTSSDIHRVQVPFPRIITPAKTAYIPLPVNAIRDIPQKTTPIPTTRILQPQPPKPIATNPSPLPVIKPSIPVVPITPQATPDPLQEWTKLAKLGSYGLVTIANNQGVNSHNPISAHNPQPSQTPPPQSQPPGVSLAQMQSPKSVAVGTSVKAVLATAVFGETTRSTNNNDKNKNEDNKAVFVVLLKQPLRSVDNTIALPEKTELLAEISSISEQGLLQLNAIKVILPNHNNPIEKSLPPNAIIIRGSQGQPLIANQYPNRGGSIAGMDTGLFILGGLGKVAELSNRTNSQVVTNAGGTIITNANPGVNVLTGVLQGGATSIVPQIAQRNQQAISQLSQRTNIWFLPAGRQIEVYVNKSMQF